ncbi:MAG: DUF1295 domain-containing protein [Thermoplasmatota archaeon]
MGGLVDTVFAILLISQFILAGVVFVLLMFIAAPYGKHSRKGWGPVIGSRSAWIIMELPAVFVILAVYTLFNDGISPVPMVMLFLWEAHYIYRTFLYPSFFRGSKRNFPIFLVFFAFPFNIMNGFINGYFIASRSWELGWLITIPFISGTILFIGGFLMHVRSDARIRALRKPGEKGYSIPHGGGFRFISNPNYLGEIVEWCGWALLTFSLPGASFALFTVANLVPRAISNHRWYRQTFDDYPQERKMLLPFIY